MLSINHQVYTKRVEWLNHFIDLRVLKSQGKPSILPALTPLPIHQVHVTHVANGQQPRAIQDKLGVKSSEALLQQLQRDLIYKKSQYKDFMQSVAPKELAEMLSNYPLFIQRPSNLIDHHVVVLDIAYETIMRELEKVFF